jgi:hypothetical protein
LREKHRVTPSLFSWARLGIFVWICIFFRINGSLMAQGDRGILAGREGADKDCADILLAL